MEKDEDEEDRWWEEKQEKQERQEEEEKVVNKVEKLGNKVTKKDAATDPWEWRGSPKEEEEEEAEEENEEKKTRGPAQTLDDFENDNVEEEEDRDICNFDLDLYSGAF